MKDIQETQTLTQEDLSGLFGYGLNAIRVEAENAWQEGKDADANPYPLHSSKWHIWNDRWILCNKNC